MASLDTVLAVLLSVIPTLAADVPHRSRASAPRKMFVCTLDPPSSFWSASRPGLHGQRSVREDRSRYRTEVRTRWTKDNLYFLFICPYEELNLKPYAEPAGRNQRTMELGRGRGLHRLRFSDIKRYKEFEVSPQGEWVDLDIDLKQAASRRWLDVEFRFRSAGAKSTTHKHVWYGAMRIPFRAIDTRPPAAGNTLRINLFRSGGPPTRPYGITWQPTMSKTFHVPEKFGLIKLVEEGK